jgi:prepilin-type N-terminal cleavage/methylation domain-containing protein
MKRTPASYLRSQSGYTLVEVVITAAIGAVVMSALSSVVLTSFRANMTATSRVEASTQIRNFQFRAYDDFARSKLPLLKLCGDSQANACTTTPVVMQGLRVTDPIKLSTALYEVRYVWDGVSSVDRQAGIDPPKHLATNVTNFQWWLDGNTVTVSLTVKVYDYSETQVMLFYPRVTT